MTSKGYKASRGKIKKIKPWKILKDNLRVNTYRYELDT